MFTSERRSTRRNSDPTAALGAVAVGASVLAVGALLYGIATAVVHLTIFGYSRAAAAQHGEASRSLTPAKAVFCGWLAVTLLIGIPAAVASRSAGAIAAVAICALPLALLVLSQLRSWQAKEYRRVAPGSVVLGQTRDSAFFVSSPYIVDAGQRLRHMVIHGPTGSGKSTLLANLIVSDIESGAGVCVIDPKDDLVDRVLSHIPAARQQDVILLDGTEGERPLGFNPLSGIPADRRTLAASETISVLQRYFSDSWGPRLEHILTNVVLALLETPGATLLDVRRLLLDEQFRRWALGHVHNPGVRQFFELEFDQGLGRRPDALLPILNKIGPWLTYPELRRIVGQPRSSFSIRDVMDAGKILLVRIPQGVLGESASQLLGALIVAKVQLAAQSRADTAHSRRRHFYLYVDEFQNFATSSFTKVITEARAFGLGLICANQYPEQLSKELQVGIASNVATIIQCVHDRKGYQIEVRSRDAGSDTKPLVFSAPSPRVGGDELTAHRLRALSSATYGRPAAIVEAAIQRRLTAVPRAPGVRAVAGGRVVIDED